MDTKEILHTNQREKAISELKEMLTPERADELRTIANHYQQKLRDYRELSRTNPLLAYCRITMPDCVRNGDMLVTHVADGTEVCMGEDMLPGGPVNSREVKRLANRIRKEKSVAIEVYSDKTSYYMDGNMYAKVSAV